MMVAVSVNRQSAACTGDSPRQTWCQGYGPLTPTVHKYQIQSFFLQEIECMRPTAVCCSPSPHRLISRHRAVDRCQVASSLFAVHIGVVGISTYIPLSRPNSGSSIKNRHGPCARSHTTERCSFSLASPLLLRNIHLPP